MQNDALGPCAPSCLSSSVVIPDMRETDVCQGLVVLVVGQKTTQGYAALLALDIVRLQNTSRARRVKPTSSRQRWRALAPPMEAMAFDFYEAAVDMTPAEAELRVSATAGGVCNAVAFWFELQLDATTSLSTSPYADKARCTSLMIMALVRCWLSTACVP